MKLPDAPFPTPPGVVYRSGKNRGICPRCDVFIVPTSRVVRLHQSEHPRATPDLRRSADTGRFYMWDRRPISPKARWFVHERCYAKHYGLPGLPPELEAQLAADFVAFCAAEAGAFEPLADEPTMAEARWATGAEIEAALAAMDSEDDE